MLGSAVAKFKIIIRDLATVGKIQSEIVEADPVKITELITEIELSIEDKITSAKANISTHIQVEEIRFSKKNLRSIIYNLISNAIKFKSPERNPEIVIITSMEKDFILLSVQDNGLGIPEQEQANVFNMYKRVHENIEGLGHWFIPDKKNTDASGGKFAIESEVVRKHFRIHFKNSLAVSLK